MTENDIIQAATRTDGNDLIGAAFSDEKQCPKEKCEKKKISFAGVELESIW